MPPHSDTLADVFFLVKYNVSRDGGQQDGLQVRQQVLPEERAAPRQIQAPGTD